MGARVMAQPLAEADRQSLRGFLDLVARKFPDELVRIREPVGQIST